MRHVHSADMVSMPPQVFPTVAISFDLLSTFFIAITVTQLLINLSNVIQSFLMWVGGKLVFGQRSPGKARKSE